MEPKPTISNIVKPVVVLGVTKIPVNKMSKSLPNVKTIRVNMTIGLKNASESQFVDRVTNSAADIISIYGTENEKRLADRINKWIDDILGNAGFIGKILKAVPLKRILSSGIRKLVSEITEWLRDFSTATDEKS